eukprot:COSAG06_NODE_8171_length_2251_cov_1.225372_4_plen_166_part_00
MVSVSFCVSIYLRHLPRDNCLGPCRFRGAALRDGHRRVRIGAQKLHTLCCSIILLAFGLKPIAANEHSFLRTKRNTLSLKCHSNVTQMSLKTRPVFCTLHTQKDPCASPKHCLESGSTSTDTGYDGEATAADAYRCVCPAGFSGAFLRFQFFQLFLGRSQLDAKR